MLYEENEISDVIEVFQKSNMAFLAKNQYLFESQVSERTLCGALMLELSECIKSTPFSDYYVDVEYNRNRGNIKTTKKTVRGPKEEIITIVCDLIVHSRGENRKTDNLIAIEMKKSYRSQLEKDKDRTRLKCLTVNNSINDWSMDGMLLPEHVCGYKLGVYYEVNIRANRISIEYYIDGRMTQCFELDIFQNKR